MSSVAAAGRATLYRLLALGFDYPRAELAEALRSGEFQAAVAAAAGRLQLPGSALPRLDCSALELEAEYLSLFELGPEGPAPCPLRESAYCAGPVPVLADQAVQPPGLMEDLLRFYHFFGLRLTSDPAERLPPDHLVCQLEMLSFLSDRQEDAPADAAAATWYWDAQRDFLGRHLQAWLPQLSNRLHRAATGTGIGRFYLALADLLLAAAAAQTQATAAPVTMAAVAAG